VPETSRFLVLVCDLGALDQACLQRLLTSDVRFCCLDRDLTARPDGTTWSRLPRRCDPGHPASAPSLLKWLRQRCSDGEAVWLRRADVFSCLLIQLSLISGAHILLGDPWGVQPLNDSTGVTARIADLPQW